MKEIKILHEKALKLASEYRKAEWQMIDIMQELDKEKLYYYYDCKSLFRYCLDYLKLSESAAYTLIRISRKAEQIPELKEKVKTGEIATTKASKICSVLKPENPDHNSRYAKPKDLSLKESQANRDFNQAWLKKAATLTSRELEKEIIKEKPLDHSLRENNRQLSEDHHSLSLKLSKEDMKLLERLKEVTRKDSFTEALKIAAEDYLKKKDPLKKKISRRLVAQKMTRPGTSHRCNVPEATKAKLYRKQKSQCQRCGTMKYLEIHHVKPVSLGGTNDLDNLELICSSCHRQHHFFGKKTSKQSNTAFEPPN